MSEINHSNLAKIIDLTNEFVIKHDRLHSEFKPTPENAHSYIYKLDNALDIDLFEHSIHIMEELGYVKLIWAKDSLGREYIKELSSTNKGVLLYFNGGIRKELKRQKRKDFLYKWGQVAVIVAGLYYAIEILKSSRFFS
jgi:hypothetical protein